jgi:GMP synthase (glutamine-hydrolysing)
MGEKVIILDFGGQYAQLIARMIRGLKVYCEIMPYNVEFEELQRADPSALVFSGGSVGSPANISIPNASHYERFFELGIPILGICDGMWLMARGLYGELERGGEREYRETSLTVKEKNKLLKGLGERFRAWTCHGNHVATAPPGFKVIAEGDQLPVAAMADSTRDFYGLQFHPEVADTPEGRLILSNFLFEICHFPGDWTADNFIKKSVREIGEKIKGGMAICGLSGGIDSSVAAMLVHKAIGSRLTCIFVDNGLLRKGEKEQVLSVFGNLKMQIKAVDAASEFLNLLQGVTDPEMKRKIIGNHFIHVFEREAAKLGKIDCLVQGTLYPDIIESGTAATAMIKSHHNVGGLPEDMEFDLVEPLKYLFKDEVRRIAGELKLPEDIVWRHPFPGPGLAVRVLGEVTPEKVAILQEADAIVIEEIKKAGLYREIWQAFAVLPNIRSVGVKSDRRIYGHTIVLRAVTSQDGMTADWYPFPYEVLESISRRLAQEIPLVNRFVYDMTSKPPSTIEWE